MATVAVPAWEGQQHKGCLWLEIGGIWCQETAFSLCESQERGVRAMVCRGGNPFQMGFAGCPLQTLPALLSISPQ